MGRVWEDRVVEKPRTFIFQDNGDGTITLIPSPGTIIAVGTPVLAVSMNGIENDAALSDSIKGAIETPTYTNGDITQIVHAIAGVMVRTDTFTYTPTLITEVKTLANGATKTSKYYFNADGSYNRTEVS